MKRTANVFTALALASTTLLVQSVPYASENPAAASDIELICLTEQPAIREGQRATLRAWLTTVDGRSIDTPINVKWEANAGRIESQAGVTRWDLSTVSVAPRPVRKVIATVTATQAGRTDLRCAVEVFIDKKEATSPAPEERGLISARRYLLPTKREASGFGLYSYLLFSAPPKGPEERARYLKTVEACLLLLQEVDDYMSRHVPPSKLNATYIPVTKVPDPGKSATEWAENVLAVYDYAAAQILLSKLRQAYQQGPYLLSVLKPLQEPDAPAHLWQDLTGVVPEMAWEWVKFFTYLAAQQRSWSEESLQRFGLKLRNLIAVGGKVTPDVMKGLEKAIQFKPKV